MKTRSKEWWKEFYRIKREQPETPLAEIRKQLDKEEKDDY